MRTSNLCDMIKAVHIIILCGVIGVLFFMTLRLFFLNLEKGVALDGAKSSLELQRKGLASLEAFVNESIKNCAVSVADFERLVRVKYGFNVYWNSENDSWGSAGFGLRVTKNESCIVVINLDRTP